MPVSGAGTLRLVGRRSMIFWCLILLMLSNEDAPADAGVIL